MVGDEVVYEALFGAAGGLWFWGFGETAGVTEMPLTDRDMPDIEGNSSCVCDLLQTDCVCKPERFWSVEHACRVRLCLLLPALFGKR